MAASSYYVPVPGSHHQQQLKSAVRKTVRFDLPDRIPTPAVLYPPRPSNPTSQVTMNPVLSHHLGSSRSTYGAPGSTILDFASPTSAPYPLSYSPTPRAGGGPATCTPITAAELSAPATSPPLSQLRIICRLIPQWPVSVAPSLGRAYVTCGDVMNAIWRVLHEQVHEAEWEAVRKTSNRAITDAIARSFRARCRRHTGAEATEQAHGLKRVDFFAGYTMFDGIAPSTDCFTWELKLKAPPSSGAVGHHH